MRNRKDILEYDPVVEEVRRWRRSLQRKAGGTLEGLIRLLEQREAEERAAKEPRAMRRKTARKLSKPPATKRRKRAA